MKKHTIEEKIHGSVASRYLTEKAQWYLDSFDPSPVVFEYENDDGEKRYDLGCDPYGAKFENEYEDLTFEELEELLSEFTDGTFELSYDMHIGKAFETLATAFTALGWDKLTWNKFKSMLEDDMLTVSTTRDGRKVLWYLDADDIQIVIDEAGNKLTDEEIKDQIL